MLAGRRDDDLLSNPKRWMLSVDLSMSVIDLYSVWMIGMVE